MFLGDNMDINNISVKGLMELLLDKKVSNRDKYKINRRLKKCLSLSNKDYTDNVKSLNRFFFNNNEKIDAYLKDLEIPNYVKKYIIDYYNDVIYFIFLLSRDIDNELKEYIVSRKISGERIITVLKDDKIDNKIKNICIKKNVNNFNILDIMFDDNIDDKCRNYILSIKKKEFILALRVIPKKLLIYKLTFEYNTYNSYKFVKKYRPDIFNNISDALDERYIKSSFYRKSVNVILLNMVMSNKDEVLRIVNNVKNENTIDWLEISNLSEEYADIIIKNNIVYLNKYIDSLKIDDVLEKLNMHSRWNIKFKDLIIERRFEELVKLVDRYDFVNYLDFFKYHYYNDDIIFKTIKKFSDEEVLECLKYHCHYDENMLNFILKYRNDFNINILNNINWDNLLNNNLNNDDSINILTSFSGFVQKNIYEVNKEYIINILQGYDKKLLLNFLSYKDNKRSNFVKAIQFSILTLLVDDTRSLEYYKILIDYNIKENVLDAFRKVEIFLNSNNISIKSFFQYGVSNLDIVINSIIDIVSNNKINDFILVKNYLFDNLYGDTVGTALMITNLNKIIINYCLYEKLLVNIAGDNIKLNVDNKNNLLLLFNTKVFSDVNVNTLFELEEKKIIILKKYKDIILNDNLQIKEIKDIFFHNIISFDDNMFNNIGKIDSLRILQRDNKGNDEIYYLIEEIITSMDLFNKISMMSDRDKLVKIVISYIDREDTIINNMIDNVININSMIRKLYELDSMCNLTTLDMARKVKNIYNEDYMELYGGEVFDFSDKNYVLYAHVISGNEKVEDLINGVSTGSNNFISFSPISYRGQKYYYDYCDCILAYDKILDDSFIYSSLSNMSSNALVKKNTADVKEVKRNQRGILETSSVTLQNAESLFYREGLKPCGIILINGKAPSDMEIMIHNKYNLPFIITQSIETAIEGPKMVFESNRGKYVDLNRIEEINGVKKYIDSNFIVKKENNIYTGREIALFTDTHAMYEPTIAILEDIRYRGIEEIYSLGDNTSVGPSPREVLDLLDKYNVKQIMGNDEYYLTLGSKPFTYFDEEKERSLDWTYDKVSSYINDLKLFKASRDVVLGNKKIALCHFGNDIRWDFNKHNTFTYQDNFGSSSSQFLFTNSDEYKEEIEYMINKYGMNTPCNRGYLSSKNDPLFDGKLITSYDDVFQGHVHFALEDKLYNTNIHTLRGAGMGEKIDNRKNMAYYLVLKERKDGNFDIEKVLVPFNKNSLLSSIYASDMPSKKKILEYLK